MKAAIINLAISLLFAFAISAIPPYPNVHDDLIFLVALITFLCVSYRLLKTSYASLWNYFGLITFGCYIFVYCWFWYGAMKYDLWFPPAPEIIQLFFFVDGEASYDAMVSNLFLILWLVTVGILALNSPNKSLQRT
ncbi:MAG: hypothetical protein ACW7DR_20240 [Paraglaciecola chathamensis]